MEVCRRMGHFRLTIKILFCAGLRTGRRIIRCSFVLTLPVTVKVWWVFANIEQGTSNFELSDHSSFLDRCSIFCPGSRTEFLIVRCSFMVKIGLYVLFGSCSYRPCWCLLAAGRFFTNERKSFKTYSRHSLGDGAKDPVITEWLCKGGKACRTFALLPRSFAPYSHSHGPRSWMTFFMGATDSGEINFLETRQFVHYPQQSKQYRHFRI
jgi:hypothetical protein